MTQVRRSHPSHEAPPCLAISKRSAAPFSLLFRPPVYSSPSSSQRNKGHAQRLLIFLAGRLPGWQSRKRKYGRRSNVAGCYRSGLVLLFSRFCQSILTGRVATHLRKNAEPEWKRPRVKRYGGRCARSPPLQRTSGTLTRRVLTLIYGTSDCVWHELAHFGEFSGKSNFVTTLGTVIDM